MTLKANTKVERKRKFLKIFVIIKILLPLVSIMFYKINHGFSRDFFILKIKISGYILLSNCTKF